MPKQLVRLGAETLLERSVRVASEAGLYPIFGVVPAGLAFGSGTHGMLPVVNHDTAGGMASSIRLGLRTALGGDIPLAGVVLLTCDQPAVTADHLRQLCHGDDQVRASLYAGKKGVPAYFPASALPELESLHGDSGARDLLNSAQAIELQDGELDIDTVADLERGLKKYTAVG